MEKKYYVYAWRKKSSGEVFYVGKGHGKRYKEIGTCNRNAMFREIVATYECEPFFLKQKLTEEDAYRYECDYIKMYKSIGQAIANVTDGDPSGGDVMNNWSDERRQEFINKITNINQERCRTEEFITQARERMVQRYIDPDERKKQSERAHAYWDDENHKKLQSERVKMAISRYPDMYQKRSLKFFKPCVLEFDGQILHFQSRKQLEEYLATELHFTPDRRTLGNQMKNKIPYSTSRKKFKHLNGMLVYYEGVETIETTENGRE